MKIDSGADVNILSAGDWKEINRLGREGISNLVRGDKCIEKLLDYNGKEIPIKGAFAARIEAVGMNKPTVEAKFFVAASRPQAVLSYQTAREMNILKIGYEVGCVRKVGTFPVMAIEPIKFEVDETVRPSLCIYNNIPLAFEEEVDQYWADLEAKDIIEPVKGAPIWLSRVEVVPKRLGGFRIVIDMRPANKAISRVHYPMPNQEKLLNKLNGAKYFSKLDLSSAYFHIPIAEESRYLTAFMTKKGAMQYTRLPFGINCAPEIFQRIMDETFGDIEGLIIFLDDLLIFSEKAEILQETTQKVLERISSSNLTINKEKSVFEVDSVEFLGMIISQDGVQPSEEKIKAIVDFPQPQTYKELRGFLGLMTFISSHIKNFSTKSEPLRRLLAGKSTSLKGARLLPFWETDQQEAFMELKRVAAGEIITRGYFDRNAKTFLQTDASNVGLGAMLFQKDDEGLNRVNACASKSLTETEKAYPQTQREALAVVWATKKFHYYLAGREFTIVTDHEPLKFIFGGTSSKTSKRAITRAEGWALHLSSYRFKVETVTGASNVVDALSRQLGSLNDEAFNSSDDEDKHAQELQVNIQAITQRSASMSVREVAEETESDPELQAVIASLSNGIWDDNTKRYKPFASDMTVRDGLLIRSSRLVVPRKMQIKVIEMAHRSHPGMSTTKHLLRQHTWWLGMDRDIEKFIASCLTCIQLSQMNRPEPMKMTKLPEGPWQSLAIDFYSVGEIDEKILAIVDYYSRYIEIVIMADTTAEATIKALEKVFCKLGWPYMLKSDNGPQFASAIFKEWAQSNDIKHELTTPRFAQENGLVERQMKGITRALAIAKIEKLNWRNHLGQYVCDYNSWPHSVTQVPPRELLFGRVMRSQLPNAGKPMRSSNAVPFDDDIRSADFNYKDKKKIKIDRQRRAITSDLTVGDFVHIKKDIRNSKIDPIFTAEKYKITARSGGRVTIDYNGKKLIRKTIHLKKAADTENDLAKELEDTGKQYLELDDPMEAHEQAALRRSKRMRKSPERFCDINEINEELVN